MCTTFDFCDSIYSISSPFFQLFFASEKTAPRVTLWSIQHTATERNCKQWKVKLKRLFFYLLVPSFANFYEKRKKNGSRKLLTRNKRKKYGEKSTKILLCNSIFGRWKRWWPMLMMYVKCELFQQQQYQRMLIWVHIETRTHYRMINERRQ